MKKKVKQRPTETAAGLGLFAAVYAALTQAGLDTVLAAILALVAAFGPALVTGAVDAARRE